MQRNGFLIILIVLAILVAVDLYAYKGIKVLLRKITSNILRRSISLTYWIWSIAVVLMTIALFLRFADVMGHVVSSKSYFIPFTAIAIIIINLLPKLWFIIFHAVEDIGWVSFRGVKKITRKAEDTGEVMDRFTFLSKIGLLVASVQFGWLFYGVTKGRFNFKIFEETLEFDNLPQEFDGLKAIQISDLHLGSFYNNYDEVAKGIKMINDINPDVIFFTGDLINNYAWEVDRWENVLKRLNAKMGVYSILGNHDYGDYATWKTTEEKENNLIELEKRQKEIGFRLLKNESVRLERGGSFIDLIGLENWGTAAVVNHGNLKEAMKNTSADSFKILLSHDPSHWDAQVNGKTNIPLTLSGHTHGMQFGIQIPGFKWSPAQYMYKQWAGLYKDNNQYIYVNRGFGYTAFPGRVGISPEITVINLKRTNSVL